MAARPYKMVLEQAEVQALLEHMARSLMQNPCPLPRCPNCVQHSRLWWDLFNELDGYRGISLHAHMIEAGIPLPAHPVLDVE